jgi:hypothetical protein
VYSSAFDPGNYYLSGILGSKFSATFLNVEMTKYIILCSKPPVELVALYVPMLFFWISATVAIPTLPIIQLQNHKLWKWPIVNRAYV